MRPYSLAILDEYASAPDPTVHPLVRLVVVPVQTLGTDGIARIVEVPHHKPIDSLDDVLSDDLFLRGQRRLVILSAITDLTHGLILLLEFLRFRGILRIQCSDKLGVVVVHVVHPKILLTLLAVFR